MLADISSLLNRQIFHGLSFIVMTTPIVPANQRRQDSFSAAHILVLTVATATAAVFSVLYIRGQLSQRAIAQAAVATAPAAISEISTTPVQEAHSPSALMVEQVLVAAGDDTHPPEKFIARTPAVYPTGTLQWTPEQVAEATELRAKLAAVLRHQNALDRELARIESEWRRLVRVGSPEPLLPSEVLPPTNE